MRQLFLTIIAICSIVLCYGQVEEYKATVLLAPGDIPVEGINVKTKGGVKVRTSTNFQGTFIVRDAEYPFKVILSHKNYVKSTFVVKSADDNVFRVGLSPKAVNNTQTGTAKEIESRETDSETSFIDRLRTVPGLTIQGGSVIIRGPSSVNLSSAPLIMLDGSRFDGSIFDININPSDIKSIRVLKGADASGYGMLGAGGVIVIKTKSSR